MNKIISSVITGIVFAIVAMLISWIGNVAEFFDARKENVKHDEILMSMKLQRQFKE
ncbi:hypothetical protein PGO14_04825 [Klebsiella aerogenes]